MSAVLSRNASRVDPRANIARQQSAWASGDYAAAGTGLQIVSEELCETVKLCADERVLDVAAGAFHAALAAARRWCDVTATDDASDLVNRSRPRLEASSAGVRFVDAEPSALPFPDQSFGAVISAFGVTFAPDQERAASEMIRVCRRGGRVGVAAWTPQGFMGRLFSTVGQYLPPPAADSPFRWGTEDRLFELFGVYGHLEAAVRQAHFRARTAIEWLDRLRTNYPPVTRAFAALDAPRQKALRGELLELAQRFNAARDGSLTIEAEYLEAVVRRR